MILYVNGNNATYFDSSGVEKFIDNKKIITNIYRMQAYDSMMCGYFCIIFIDFIQKQIWQHGEQTCFVHSGFV